MTVAHEVQTVILVNLIRIMRTGTVQISRCLAIVKVLVFLHGSHFLPAIGRHVGNSDKSAHHPQIILSGIENGENADCLLRLIDDIEDEVPLVRDIKEIPPHIRMQGRDS